MQESGAVGKLLSRQSGGSGNERFRCWQRMTPNRAPERPSVPDMLASTPVCWSPASRAASEMGVLTQRQRTKGAHGSKTTLSQATGHWPETQNSFEMDQQT